MIRCFIMLSLICFFSRCGSSQVLYLLTLKNKGTSNQIWLGLLGAGLNNSRGALTGLNYSGSPYTFTQNQSIAVITPTLSETVTTCLSSPSLPSGIVIDNANCALSGTPTVLQNATRYTIAAVGTSQVTADISIAVTLQQPAPSALTYTGSPYSINKNVNMTTITPTVTGTVTSCTASPALPAGLSIDNTTCAISGTPSVSQLATNHTITAFNSTGNTTAVINLLVYRILFLSAGTIAGSSILNSANADAFCNADTNKVAGTGNYKAMIVFSTRTACTSSNCTSAAENVDWVLSPLTEYRRPNGTTIIMTTNTAGIFVFGTLTNSIGTGVFGTWTGLSSSWLTLGATGTCGGSWSVGLTTGRYARESATNSLAISEANGGNCNSTPGRLYCAQQ